jgi:hypothetical protein
MRSYTPLSFSPASHSLTDAMRARWPITLLILFCHVDMSAHAFGWTNHKTKDAPHFSTDPREAHSESNFHPTAVRILSSNDQENISPLSQFIFSGNLYLARIFSIARLLFDLLADSIRPFASKVDCFRHAAARIHAQCERLQIDEAARVRGEHVTVLGESSILMDCMRLSKRPFS